MGRSEQSIFVVDDDEGILASFDAILGDEYSLVLLDNGKTALQIIFQQEPKLLFLDIKMRGMNGLEILRQMRQTDIETKVVIMTALPEDKYEEIAKSYGVYRYLKKPLEVDDVEKIARSVIH